MLNIRHKVRTYLLETLNVNPNIWYHGSPDVRELEVQGGFTNKFLNIEYIKDIQEYYKVQDELHAYFNAGDMDNYHRLLDEIPNFKASFKLRSPIFLSNDYGVAKTYAIASRSTDYQNAVEGVYKVEVDAGKNVKIAAHGDRFRFIDLDKVKAGFVNAGFSPEEFDKTAAMFNYYLKDKTKIKTDMIAAIGDVLGVDTIDVLGVLDSYEGGNVRSTVRMVFDASSIKIIK